MTRSLGSPLLGSTVCVLAVEVLAVRLGTLPVRKFAVMSAIVVTVLTVSSPSMNNACHGGGSDEKGLDFGVLEIPEIIHVIYSSSIE